MTYNVFGGMLNLAQLQLLNWKCWPTQADCKMVNREYDVHVYDAGAKSRDVMA